MRRAHDQHVQRLAASIAFYALFSLPALLVAAIHLAGMVYGEDAARGRLVTQVARYFGENLATTVDSVIAGAVAAGATRPWPRVVALLALGIGASLTFVEVQHGVNVVWGTASSRRWYLALVVKRLVSFAMVLVAGALLMVTMAVSVGIARFGSWMTGHLPRELASGVLRWLEPLLSFGMLAVLFLLLFKVLPDGRVPWKRARVAAFVTASLLVAARALVAQYLAVVDVASAYGAAGSLVVLLVWVYVSCLVVLLGGAFAFAWDAEPEPGAPGAGVVDPAPGGSEPRAERPP